MSQLWMISYDVSDDKRRRQIHDRLTDHGERVQWSVFECFLDAQTRALLRSELQALLEDDEGSIRWYPLCEWCKHEVQHWGRGEVDDEPEFYLV